MAYLNEPLQFGQPADFGPQVQMPKPKAGMFGAGKANIGEILSAAISGYLASRGNPVGMAGLQMLHQRRADARQADMAEQQYQRHREDGFQDFVRKEAYKAANPGAINNDTVQDYNFRVQTLGKEAADDWLRNPPQFMNVPGVGLVQVPRTAGPQMGAPAPQGVTFTPMDEGGPMPSASGGFPRPR